VKEPGSPEVFLFFRAHEEEWWLGPVVGGTECYAKATGSLLQVVPDAGGLVWRSAVVPTDRAGASSTARDDAEFAGRLGAMDGAAALGAEGEELRAIAATLGELSPDVRWWCGLALTLALVIFGWSQVMLGGVEAADGAFLQHSSCDSTPKKSSSLACVVCLEAPREILLLPCRHVCCCRACADRMERCPMCRAQKTAFAKVFL